MKTKQKDCLKNCHFITHSLKNHTLILLMTDMLRELLCYNVLSIVKISKAYRGYARSYSMELIN